MPGPRKLDLIPEELRERLKHELKARGFADIVAVTEDLNFWLEQQGLQITVGKTAVGEFSKLLKDQREAFAWAETLLSDTDIEQESDMHKVLLQMIATSAMHLMKSMRDEDKQMQASELMAMGRMLKDLMSSAGVREKISADERKRVAEEAREAERDAIRSKLDTATNAGGAEAAAAQAARRLLGFA